VSNNSIKVHVKDGN